MIWGLILLEINRMVEGGVKKTIPVLRFSIGDQKGSACFDIVARYS